MRAGMSFDRMLAQAMLIDNVPDAMVTLHVSPTSFSLSLISHAGP